MASLQLAFVFLGLIAFAQAAQFTAAGLFTCQDTTSQSSSIPYTDAGYCVASSGTDFKDYAKLTILSDTQGQIAVKCTDSACTQGCETYDVTNGQCKQTNAATAYIVTWITSTPQPPPLPPPPPTTPGVAYFDIQSFIGSDQCGDSSGATTKTNFEIGQCIPAFIGSLGPNLKFDGVGTLTYGCSDSTCETGCSTITVSPGVCKPYSQVEDVKVYWGSTRFNSGGPNPTSGSNPGPGPSVKGSASTAVISFAALFICALFAL